jgi:ribosome-binding factor A
MNKVRNRKVADQIRLSLSEILLREVRDPDIGFVTITGVDMSPDLRYATVHVSILSAEQQDNSSLEALQKATPFIRRALSEKIRLRHVPELRFQEDRTGERADRIEKLIDQIQHDRPLSDEET